VGSELDGGIRLEEGASAHSICQSEGNLISAVRTWPPLSQRAKFILA
jgi:hypothetical protein